MSIESAADRAAFFADFGTVVSWVVGAAPAVTVTAIFDNGVVPQDFGLGGGALNRRATLTLRQEDLPGDGDESDVLTIAGVGYHPKDLKRDGTGMVVLTLERIES